MKKLFSGLFSLLLASTLSAQSPFQITGAALTYEHDHGDRFVFTLQMTVECQQTNNLPWPQVTLNNGSNLNLSDAVALDSSCNTPSNCFVLNGTNSRTYLLTFKSTPQRIVKPAPGSPHSFYFSIEDSLRSSVGTNYFNSQGGLATKIEAKMFAEGYPQSSPQVSFIGGDYRSVNAAVSLSMPHRGLKGDSTYAQLTSLTNLMNTSHPFDGTMSTSAPLQVTSLFDGKTGLITGDSLSNYTRYYVGQKVEGFKDGQLVSEITWDRSIYAVGNWVQNSSVNVSLISSSVPVFSFDSTTYYVKAFVPHGDTLKLGFSGVNNGTFVGMEAKLAQGQAGLNSPSIQAASGFTNPTFLPQIDFEYIWVPDSLDWPRYTSILTVFNHDCPTAYRNIIIEVNTDPAVIPTDTIRACAGTVVALPLPALRGGGSTWSPSTGVNCNGDTCELTVTDSATLNYTYNGFITHRVYVEKVEPLMAQINFSGNAISLVNPGQWDTFEWYHFGVRVPNASTSQLSNPIWGLYRGRFDELSTSCVSESNLIGVNMPQSLLSVFNSSKFSNEEGSLNQGDSISYLIEKDGPLTVWPQSVLLPGATLNGTLEMRVYRNGSLIHTSQGQDLGGTGIEFSFPHNGAGPNLLWKAFEQMRFSFVVTSGSPSLPMGDTLQSNKVYGDLRLRSGLGFPGSSSRMLPIVVRTYPGIGVSELESMDRFVYPNPASDFIRMEGVESGTYWSLVDMTGRPVLDGALEGSQIDISSLETGIYLLLLDGTRFKIQVVR